MNHEQAVAFLKALGAKQIQSQASMGDWVKAACPLAPFTHKNQQDSSPSFGFNIEPGKYSNYNCFACSSGSAAQLLQTLEMYCQQSPGRVFPDFKAARTILDQEDIEVLPLPEYSEFGEANQQVFQEWPEYWLESFPSVKFFADPMTYLVLDRTVPDHLISQHDLRWDMKKRMVVFPYRNVYGKLAGARGRAVDKDVEGWKRHFDYTWNKVNNAGLVWFNEPCLQLDGPVVVVEGQFDCLRVLEGGWAKCVGNLTAKPPPQKFKKLAQSELIIHIPDADLPGMQSVEYYQKLAHQNGVPYKVLELPASADGSKLDPALCHPQYLRDRIEELL